MTDESRLEQLLDELLDSDATPESVCASCPELLPQVRDRWRQICHARADLDALFPSPSASPGDASPTHGPLPEVPGYEVESVLGVGGMGVVYRAKHLGLSRHVALKMALAGAYAGSQERERFQREAEAVASLRHPNVVQIHDVGVAGGRPYFTMEYVEGGSLSVKLAGKPLPAREAAELLATLAIAVQAAHANGIIHRDLKPANVLLTADGIPKVSDFGLARRLSDEAKLTRTGAALGTPSYMAPEQARGRADAVDVATDVYALGAILYELLTGRPPFLAESSAETIFQLLSRDPVPPSRLNGRVPRDLETICLKCLSKEPRSRYSSAAALADDLNRFLRGEAISARPDGPVKRLVRRVRRRPALSAAVAISAMLSLTLAGAGLWYFTKQATTARAAEKDLQEMVRSLEDSLWVDAAAARDRAAGRLGEGGPAELHRLIDQGTRELSLAERLDKIRPGEAGSIGGVIGSSGAAYGEAFSTAGIGTIDEEPDVVAGRIRETHIRNAVVAALDHWSVCTRDDRLKRWILKVAQLADPDGSGWRDRARDPDIRLNQAALAELIRTAPVTDAPVSLLHAVESSWQAGHAQHIDFLKRILIEHPEDFWTNHRISNLLFEAERYGESVGYFQAAVAIRPKSAMAHNNLARALKSVGLHDDAVRHYRRAVVLDPRGAVYQSNLVRALAGQKRQDEAFAQLERAIQITPNSGVLQSDLAVFLDNQGRTVDAITTHNRAIELDPASAGHRLAFRDLLLRLGRLEQARSVWGGALALSPPNHGDWYGHAELCLFLGDEREYLSQRRLLLERFGSTVHANIAERTARACLILPMSAEELTRVKALSDRALVNQSKSPDFPYFLFARGLTEFRQGRYEEAIATMRGDASRVLGPAPRLVLAMALHNSNQPAEALQVLAAAIVKHDWRAPLAVNRDEWIYHVLRREAQRLILPNLPAYLAGKYQTQNNLERLAMVGECQFHDRTLALARLYLDAFDSGPSLASASSDWHRWQATRAAALAGCGRGADAKNLSEPEKEKWRSQARQWLRADSAYLTTLLARTPNQRDAILFLLRQPLTHPDLAGLREPAELEKLPADERQECAILWDELRALVKQIEPKK